MLEQSSTSNHNLFPSHLWIESGLTHNYMSPHIPFPKQKRFKWSSIYWPEIDKSTSNKYKNISNITQNARKVSKMIDEQEKNELRNKFIKHSISKANNQIGSPRKESLSIQQAKRPFRLSKINENVLNRLTLNQTKLQSTLRDRHGNRCNLYENPQTKAQQQDIKSMSRTTGFSTSRKFRLDLPHNYFPGPGTYDIKRYLSQLDTQTQKQSKRSNQNPANSDFQQI